MNVNDHKAMSKREATYFLHNMERIVDRGEVEVHAQSPRTGEVCKFLLRMDKADNAMGRSMSVHVLTPGQWFDCRDRDQYPYTQVERRARDCARWLIHATPDSLVRAQVRGWYRASKVRLGDWASM